MKTLLSLLVLVISFSSSAQVFDGNYSGLAQSMSAYQDAYEKSDEVLNFIESNESIYNVQCATDGRAYSVFPFVRIGFKVKCYGNDNQVVKLKIVSKYEVLEDDQIRFEVTKKVAIEKTNR